MGSDNSKIISADQIQNCICVLEKLVENGANLASINESERIKLLTIAGKLTRPDREEKKKRNREQKKALRQVAVEREKALRAQTGIRKARENAIFKAPALIEYSKEEISQQPRKLNSPRTCYVCKKEFIDLHFFYDSMCMECAELNYKKRFQSASLHGKVAIITGSRLKIGYYATLKMLRAGARVIATTRFPVDSAIRYSKEEDFKDWGDRLQIFGLDLRHTPSVELFCNFVEKNVDRLDIIVNNAAQTVRRPPAFYSHLMENELKSYQDIPTNAKSLLDFYCNCKNQLLSFSNSYQEDKSLPVVWNASLPGIGIRSSAQLSQIPYSYDSSIPAEKVFPIGQVDADLQQIDLRDTNSWRYRLGEGEIPTTELLEIQLVNSIAPFVLANKLIPLMKRDFTGQKHIVNVSAMEGKFLRWKKGDRHPHTNMAKAALNMLTHTSSDGLAEYGIYMNAVDTGWVTDEDPVKLSKIKQDIHDFQPPLDIIDGAARICDPFFDGILTGKHWCGKFLKDYFPIDW